MARGDLAQAEVASREARNFGVMDGVLGSFVGVLGSWVGFLCHFLGFWYHLLGFGSFVGFWGP